MAGSRWNRQGRKSGGYRKATIHLPRPEREETLRQCIVCARLTPPYDEACDGCRAIRALKDAGKIQ